MGRVRGNRNAQNASIHKVVQNGWARQAQQVAELNGRSICPSPSAGIAFDHHTHQDAFVEQQHGGSGGCIGDAPTFSLCLPISTNDSYSCKERSGDDPQETHGHALNGSCLDPRIMV